MDLSKPNKENIRYIINWINEKLRVVNVGAINPATYETENYDDLLDIYYMMQKKDRFSISEQEAIITELGRLRKR